MPRPPLQSSFADDESVDTSANLATGTRTLTAELTVELLDTEENEAFVTDATGADVQATMVIEEEIIYYHGRLGINRIADLQRGMEGTVPATHPAGTPVTFYNPPRYGNPAIADSIIAMQTKINNLEARLAVLEGE